MADITCVSEIGLFLHHPAARLRDRKRPRVVDKWVSSARGDSASNVSRIFNSSRNDEFLASSHASAQPYSTHTYDFASS